MAASYFNKPLVEELKEIDDRSQDTDTDTDIYRTNTLLELGAESSGESDHKSLVDSYAEAAQQLLREEVRQAGTFSLASPLLQQVLQTHTPIRLKNSYEWSHQHNEQALHLVLRVLRTWSRGTNQDSSLLAVLSRNNSGTENPVREEIAKMVLINVVIGDPDDGKDLVNLLIEENKTKNTKTQQFLQEVLEGIRSTKW